MKKSELKEFIKSEIISELKVETPIKEGSWSVLPKRIPEFLRALKKLKDDYYEVVGSDDVFDGLDRAESAAEALLSSRGLDEDMSGVEDGVSYSDMDSDDKKQFGDYVDHSDIGQFATPRSKWNNYDDDYFYKLGVRIVKEKFAGDVARAYDAIVRPKSKEMDAVGYMGEASEEEVQNQKDLNSELEKTAQLSKELSEDEDAEPKKSDIKKNKGFNKAKDELALLTQEMKSLAKKYSKAEGEEKEQLVKTLKDKTKLKKELESILSKKKI